VTYNPGELARIVLYECCGNYATAIDYCDRIARMGGELGQELGQEYKCAAQLLREERDLNTLPEGFNPLHDSPPFWYGMKIIPSAPVARC
jgi:hypothetical protein